MKKILFFLLPFLACFGLKVSGQNYRGIELKGYNPVQEVLMLEKKFQALNTYDILKFDSLRIFKKEDYPRGGVIFYCYSSSENYEIVWGKNKLDEKYLSIGAIYKKIDKFLIRYEYESPDGRGKISMLFCHDENGNGGFFKEDPDGPFTLNVHWLKAASYYFSPLNKEEIEFFKKKVIDLMTIVKN